MSVYDQPWSLYVLRCSDGTLYTGISHNVTKRVTRHNAGRGAKYTKKRLPVVLVAWMEYPSHREACRAEYAFKKLVRQQKLTSIATDPNWEHHE